MPGPLWHRCAEPECANVHQGSGRCPDWGVPVVSDESFQWLDGGYFMVSTYDTRFVDEPVQKGVNYWGYASEAGRFRIIFFSNNGPYAEDGNRYEGVVEADTLTFEGPARFQYRLDESGKVRVNDDGTISVSLWLRDEDGEWQPWMDNRFSRVEG